MIYDYNDDENNFVSDKRVEEVNDTPKRVRSGNIGEEPPRKDNNDDDGGNGFEIAVVIIVVIVAIVAAVFLVKMLKGDDTSTSTNTTKNESTTDSTNNVNSKNSNNSSLAISSLSENYDVYKVNITSNVYKKGGNFFNNYEGIKGDKAYVEYKQISGLKDSQKQEKINEKLKDMVTSLYDKEYLADENTLFIDIHTKISVNFNTLSYVVYKTYEDIDGNRKDEKTLTYNIRLDTLEEIKFEDLFIDSSKIKEAYSSYKSNSNVTYYFDPKYIYVYDGMDETKIDMSKYYSNIAIYKRYSTSSSLFTGSKTEQKVFTINNSTVSDETLDRDFVSSK